MSRKARLFSVKDPATALALLTRLPAPAAWIAADRGAAAAWAWPLAGLAAAGPAALAGALALASGLPAGIAAALVLAVQAAITGAMHEDGLADSLDGLWGGWDRARRLEIMKDSRSGVYGVLGLVFTFLLRWQALAALMAPPGAGWVAAALGVALLSRAAMAGLAAALPPARPDGLSARVGRPGPWTAVAAAALALGLTLAVTGPAALAAAAATAAVVTLWGLIAWVKVGGQTGDILGAGQQWAEVAGLLALVALA